MGSSVQRPVPVHTPSVQCALDTMGSSRLISACVSVYWYSFRLFAVYDEHASSDDIFQEARHEHNEPIRISSSKKYIFEIIVLREFCEHSILHLSFTSSMIEKNRVNRNPRWPNDRSMIKFATFASSRLC